jgi:hypothetical protein
MTNLFVWKHAHHVRGMLVSVWCLSFVVALTVLSVLSFQNAIEWDVYKGAVSDTSAAYVPFVGAILAYYFGKARTKPARTSTIAASLALGSTVLFNAFVLARVILLPLGIGTIEAAVDILRTNGLAWVVAPALGYYFAADETGEAK